MIVGIGTDLVEVSRIAKSIENKKFLDKIFSENEMRYCESKVNKIEHYAARFAAKEAFSKALGTGFRGGISFKEIEVINDNFGKPLIKTSGNTLAFVSEKKIAVIHLSLSHIKETAVAMVILER
jgi:holo-[acyl-carrier protein] synthase